MFRWAIERSDVPDDRLRSRFEKLTEWIEGSTQPTIKQLESFAKATYTPVGYFFLNEPPQEPIPIPDFRTIAGKGVTAPSPHLLDVLYLCQQRQEWFRDYAYSVGQPKLSFVGSAKLTDDVIVIADNIRQALGFDLANRRQFKTWTDALRHFIQQADDLGILVMVSGVVGSNAYRKLNIEEFRGFTLADPIAPLVFVNGADTKAAQMFTLAHELAHVWLGETALSDVTPRRPSIHQTERWCNQVAAELLVPLKALRETFDVKAELFEEIRRLARWFKVSTLVILRRIHDLRYLNREQFWAAYDQELTRLLNMTKQSSGGDYYLTTVARVGRRFAQAVVTSALESQASFTEAFHLLGCRKRSTFEELGRYVGVDA